MLGSKVVQVGAKDEVEKRALTLVRPLGLGGQRGLTSEPQRC